MRKLCKYVDQHGFEPVILTTGSQEYKPLQRYANLRLNFYAKNFNELLLNLVKSEHIDFIEFQVKSVQYFNNIDFDSLRRVCRTGLHIHSKIDIGKIDLQWFDYVVRATSSWGDKQVGQIPQIPNWVESIKGGWSYQGQKKALFISRLDSEKFPTLLSFIGICRSIGCDFDIAGNISTRSNRVRHKIIGLLSKLDNCNYLNEIDTETFLEENVNKYLFVGGVGQVAVEAMSYSVPVLVCTHLVDYTYSRFITKENFNRFVENNFIVNINRWIPDDYQGTVDHFKQGISSNFKEFDVTAELKERLIEKVVLKDYMHFLNLE